MKNNMKQLNRKLLYFLLFGLLFTHPELSFAQTTTPKVTAKVTPKATPTTESKPLDDTLKTIKEKIEDKVDEINKSSKKVVSGILQKIDDDVIELQQDGTTIYKVSIDDTVTKFFTATPKKIVAAEKNDLEKGDLLTVFGPIIEDQISANKVIQQAHYITVQGEITNVDKDNLSIDIVTHEKEEVSLDIETATLQQIMDTKSFEVVKGGFSKYKIGDKIHAVYIKPAKEKDKATTIRTLIIPQEFFASPVTTTISPTQKP
jgi:hypothetical protein